MSGPTQVPLIELKTGQAGLVDVDKAQSAIASGEYRPAAKMIGPDGAAGYVAEEKVSAARQAKFAIAPDTPGAQKMVTPQGQVNYALPSEVDTFKKAGHTLINPDGSFYLQNIPGEDPLEEAKRYQRVRAALTPEEKAGANKNDLREFGKAGLNASFETAAGILGAGGVGTAGEAAMPVLAKAGAAGAKYAAKAGASAAGELTAENLGKHAVKALLYAGGSLVGSVLGVKWLSKFLPH